MKEAVTKCNCTMEQRAKSHGVEIPVKQTSDSVGSDVPTGAKVVVKRQVKCQFAPVPVQYSKFQFQLSFLQTLRKPERGKVRDLSAM